MYHMRLLMEAFFAGFLYKANISLPQSIPHIKIHRAKYNGPIKGDKKNRLITHQPPHILFCTLFDFPASAPLFFVASRAAFCFAIEPRMSPSVSVSVSVYTVLKR